MSVIYRNHSLMKSVKNLDAGEIYLLRHAVEAQFGIAVGKMRKICRQSTSDLELVRTNTHQTKDTADIFSTQLN